MQTSSLSVPTSPKRPIGIVLQLEGACIAVAALIGYAHMNGNWWIFALLILAPDLMMLGYLAGNRMGAVFYNVGHSYVGPLILGAVGYGLNQPLAGQLALIWIAHIGLDRAIGYGLKYASGFKQTHLARV